MVFFSGNRTAARRAAFADVIEKARPFAARDHRSYVLFAMPQRKQIINKAQFFLYGRTDNVGTEINCPVGFHTANNFNPGVILTKVNPEIRKVLIILQEDVILRHEFLDQVAFQRQCFHLAVHLNRFKIRNMRNHCPHFWRMVFGGLKILPDTVLQNLCFSDIYNRTGIIQHFIYARLFGEQSDLIFQYRIHVRSSVMAFAFSSISYRTGAGRPTTLK